MSRGSVPDAGTPPGGLIIARSTHTTESRDTLDRERVLHAAMELADEAGIESVTMRELGRKLGVKAASLYNHIAGKDDLLDGLMNLALSGIDITLDGLDWKDAMRRRAVSAREVFARHPWAAGLIDSRDRRGRESLAYVDRVLGVLIRAGFSTADAANAFLVLDSYIYGFERQRSAAPEGNGTDGTGEAREILAAIPAGEYPFAARVAAEFSGKPFDRAAAFEFGLGLILDGLERMLGRRPGRSARERLGNGGGPGRHY